MRKGFLMPPLMLAAVLIAVLVGCGAPGGKPLPMPQNKYVFIERWIEIYQDSSGSTLIDFPTYIFDPDSGELKSHIVSAGPWFPLQDLTDLKVVYGRGTSRTGQAGVGENSKIFALIEFPFTEPPKEDTDVQVTVEWIDRFGVAFLTRGTQKMFLEPGASYTSDEKTIVEWDGVRSEILSRERITNYGWQDKSKIKLMK